MTCRCPAQSGEECRHKGATDQCPLLKRIESSDITMNLARDDIERMLALFDEPDVKKAGEAKEIHESMKITLLLLKALLDYQLGS